MPIMQGLPQDFDPKSYDAIVVGAGYAGSVVARELAQKGGRRVCLLERRGHIGGNAYDCLDDAGILIHLYGPHIYHTFNKEVHEFLSRFVEFNDYEHRVLANINGQLMPVPFNHTSLLLAFGEERGEYLYGKLVQRFGENRKVPILELRATGDPELDEVAEYVYRNIFLYYTMKQWGQTPDQVDPSVTGRVPVFVGDDDRYFQSPYQGMPKTSYTDLFEHMLDHPGIDVFLGVDARDVIDVVDGKTVAMGSPYEGQVVFTGPLDELFKFEFGALPYRTLNLDFETLPVDRFQKAATVNYTTTEDFTRITEFKLLTGQVLEGSTTILREYSAAYEPGSGQTPYYAILNDENRELHRKYLAKVEGVGNFHVVGRLAEYRYYDMDGVVASALGLASRLLGQ